MINERKIDVLYIHPSGNATDYNIPMGLIGLMNSINCVKTGKMYFEVSNDEILNSKIIVMDCHWYYTLSEIGRLAGEFKKINPNVVIIAGGYTASIFAEMIVGRYKIDYVIRGDAEVPFPLLVKTLLEGKNVRRVPNIVGRGGVAAQSYKLTRKDYSKADCLSLDWFPALKRRMKALHKILPFHWNEFLGLYPFIPVFKGCPYDCKFCYAGKSLNFALCKRGIVSRSPQSVVKDLLVCSKSKDIKQVYMVADFIDVLGEKYANKIFSKKYDINLNYSFNISTAVSKEILGKMLESFNKCRLKFIFSEYFHRNSAEKTYNYLAELFDYLRQYKNKVDLTLFTMDGNRNFGKLYAKLKRINKELGFDDHSSWFIKMPYPISRNNQGGEAYFNRWIKKSRRDSKPFRASNENNKHGFYLELGSEFMEQRKNKDAARYFRQALDLDPGNGEICFELAVAYFNLKQYREAIRAVNRAAELGYKNDYIHLFLGLCYQGSRQYKKGIEELNKAKKINPKGAQMNLSLVNLLQEYRSSKIS
jgi:tetratricopeptide (TPR) repeat protein